MIAFFLSFQVNLQRIIVQPQFFAFRSQFHQLFFLSSYLFSQLLDDGLVARVVMFVKVRGHVRDALREPLQLHVGLLDLVQESHLLGGELGRAGRLVDAGVVVARLLDGRMPRRQVVRHGVGRLLLLGADRLDEDVPKEVDVAQEVY